MTDLSTAAGALKLKPKFKVTDVSALTRINIALLSEVESSLRAPAVR